MAYDPAFQAKVFPILFAAFEEHFGEIFEGRVYAQVATPLHEYPSLVYQSQDAGGSNSDKIGFNGWEGLITFRSMDITLSGAWNKAAELATAFPNVTHSGYSIRIKAQNPQMFPVEKVTSVKNGTAITGNVYTAGIITEVDVYPND